MHPILRAVSAQLFQFRAVYVLLPLAAKQPVLLFIREAQKRFILPQVAR